MVNNAEEKAAHELEKKEALKKAASEYFESVKKFYWALDDDMGLDVRYKFKYNLYKDVDRARAVLKVAKKAAKLVELYEFLAANGWEVDPAD